MPLSDECGCNAVLIENVTQYNKQKNVRRAALTLMTKELFEELKQQGKADASIPGYGEYGAEWNAYNQKRLEELQTSDKKMSSLDAEVYLKTYLSETSIKAWLACKLACKKNFSCYPESYNADQVTVLCRWTPPPGVAGQATVLSSSVLGGEAADAAVPKGEAVIKGTIFANSLDTRFAFRRQKGAPFQLVINLNLDSGGVALEPWDEEKTDVFNVEIAYITEPKAPDRYHFGIEGAYIILQRKFGTAIRNVHASFSREMPGIGADFCGNVVAYIPKESKNQVVLNGGLTPNAGIIQGEITVTYVE